MKAITIMNLKIFNIASRPDGCLEVKCELPVPNQKEVSLRTNIVQPLFTMMLTEQQSRSHIAIDCKSMTIITAF